MLMKAFAIVALMALPSQAPRIASASDYPHFEQLAKAVGKRDVTGLEDYGDCSNVPIAYLDAHIRNNMGGSVLNHRCGSLQVRLHVACTYAYVADGADGLAIIDVTNPEKPFV